MSIATGPRIAFLRQNSLKWTQLRISNISLKKSKEKTAYNIHVITSRLIKPVKINDPDRLLDCYT